MLCNWGYPFDQITVLTQKVFEKTNLANSVDSDQTPQNAASDQGLLSLPLIQQFLDIAEKSNGLVQILGQYYGMELWCLNT